MKELERQQKEVQVKKHSFVLNYTIQDTLGTYIMPLPIFMQHSDIQVGAIVLYSIATCISLHNKRISAVLLGLCWQFGPKPLPVNIALRS